MKKFLFILFVCWASINLNAQDLSAIGKGKPLKVSGGLSANQIFYTMSGIEERRDPYTYYLSGNMNFDIYGWAVPLSFTYSNQEGTFQQPFNQYGLTPTYKWAKFYAGYNSMNFSKYTMSGYRFLGGGVEVTPGLFRGAAFYGRLQKAVAYDSINATNIMAYERFGYGIKAGVGKESKYIDLIMFRAEDDQRSVSYIPESSDVTPNENIVLGVNAGFSLWKKLNFKAEFANSAFTRDTRNIATDIEEKGFYPNILFTPRISSEYYNAFNSNITYGGEGYSLGFGYERVDPGYQTMGAYYFSNDLENLTINATKQLFSGKMNLSGNMGLQKNDLDGNNLSAMKNVVGSINASYAPSNKLNLSGSYSNFSNYTNIKSDFDYINQTSPYQNLDTLNFTQLTQSANAAAFYTIGDPSSKDKRQSISANLSYQTAAEKQGYYEMHAGSRFYNGNASYSLSLVPADLTLTATFTANYSTIDISENTTLGPTLTISKSILDKKIRNSLSSSWNKSFQDGDAQTRVANIRLSSSASIKKKHNLSLSVILLNRNSIAQEEAFTEFTVTLGYSYSFSSK